MIFRKTPAVSFSVPDIKQGFSFRAVFLRRQVHYKLLRRSEKSHNGDEGVIRYRKMRADRIRCREKRKPRCFVQPRVKRGKPFVSAERGDIGRGADGKDYPYRPPQPCGKQSYQVRQQLQQHDCIEKQQHCRALRRIRFPASAFLRQCRQPHRSVRRRYKQHRTPLKAAQKTA